MERYHRFSAICFQTDSKYQPQTTQLYLDIQPVWLWPENSCTAGESSGGAIGAIWIVSRLTVWTSFTSFHPCFDKKKNVKTDEVLWLTVVSFTKKNVGKINKRISSNEWIHEGSNWEILILILPCPLSCQETVAWGLMASGHWKIMIGCLIGDINHIKFY